MSDDVRNEAAEIAHSLRRKLERERALGTGELLAAGVAKARRAGVSDVTAVPERATPARAAEPARTAAPVIEPEAGDGTFALTPPPAIEPHAAKRAARKTVVEPEPDEIDLPSFTDDLYPSALDGGRDQLVVLAEPVLKTVADEARACKKCGLCTTRTNAVPGVGSARTGIVFVGEAPGADEDARGEPFVGRAGELLTKMIAAMDEKKLVPGVKLSRETVYIANVLKCRPPENRNPLPHEIEACSPYLMRQLEALQPRVICCLGKFAAELLLQLKGTISSMRGKTYRWRGAKLIVTYHPAYCLRSPSAKRPVWDDLQRLAQEYLTD
jgi:uracil-DNA glycosylase family 4